MIQHITGALDGPDQAAWVAPYLSSIAQPGVKIDFLIPIKARRAVWLLARTTALSAYSGPTAAWVMVGIVPGLCAIIETVVLVLLNANGLVWARRIIHEPTGMVVKNIAFLVLVWVCGSTPAGRP